MAEEERPAQSENSQGKSLGLIMGGVALVVILIIAGLLLPPISLLDRLAGDPVEEPAIVAQPVAEPETVAGVALVLSSGEANVAAISQADFLAGNLDESWAAAAAALPEKLTLQSDVYVISAAEGRPHGSATIEIPAGAEPHRTLDLYGWQEGRWTFIPHQLDDGSQQMVSREGPLPQALALMQTDRPDTPAVGAALMPAQSLPTALLPLVTEVKAGALILNHDGELEGELAEIPTGGYQQFLYVTNIRGIIDQAALANLLADPAAQQRQIDAIVAQAAEGDFAGVALDYQGVAAAQQEAFTAFVANLAEGLRSQGQALAVVLGAPAPTPDGWGSAGQDWAALGEIADHVYLQMPLDPTVYGDNGQAEQLLRWAVRQVDRYKLTMFVTAHAVSKLGESFHEMSHEQALAAFGELDFVAGDSEVEPGEPIEVKLSGSASAPEWDPASLSYKYAYEENGQQYEVWLSNEAAFNHQARLAARYHLRGVALRGLGALEDGEGYAAALQNFLGAADAPQPAGAAIAWTIADEQGSVVASSSGEELAYAWQAPDAPGRFTINAVFAQGNYQAALGSLELNVQLPPTPTPEPTPEPVVEATATPEPAAQQPTAVDPGSADAAANTVSNVRSGPGLAFGIIDSLQTGQQVTLIGRNSDSTWLQIERGEDGGWVFATLLTVNPNVNVSALAVVEVEPPVAGDGSPPPPVAPPSAGGGAFAFGGQTHTLGNPALMRDVGMTWVKFQHKWGGPSDDPGGLAGRIQHAHGNGFKVLLSIPGQLHPTNIDYAAYVDFLGGVAALGPDAIEIWNEQNIDREWPAGQINPATYVNQMLAPAYNRIKSVNPNVMVIGGAPAPTGFFGGCGPNGCDDLPYIQGMAAAGAANYMDCMGVHYNEGIISPNQRSGDPRGAHYTRYFWGMTDAYWNAFGGRVPLCYTELGYLSGEDYGGVPGGFAWAGNTTVAQHAQWLAEAVSLAANSNRIRMLIIFNVDITHWGSDPQAGYSMIRADGSCPSCQLIRQVMRP